MAKKSTTQAPSLSITADYTKLGLKGQDLINMYRFMMLGREVEFKVLNLHKQGFIVGGVFTGTGNEATCVGSAYALNPREDILLPLHRDMGSYFVKGQHPRDIFCQYLGRATGPTQGRDGNIHQGDLNLKLYGTISHVGAMVPVAVGCAYACKLRKNSFVTMTYIGDGATNIGDWHEAMNLGSVLDVPLVVVIANNQYAYSTPKEHSYKCKELIDRAAGYGIPGEKVDGTDILQVYSVCKKAVQRAREGKGMTLIESETMRMLGHAAHDDFVYVPKTMLAEWKKRDPLKKLRNYLLERGKMTEAQVLEIEKTVHQEIEEAAEYAKIQPLPNPETILQGVYAE